MKKAEAKNRIHEIVAKGGDIRDIQDVLNTASKADQSDLLLSKDVCGEGLLHKAVCKGYFELVDWILKTCPGVVHLKDKFDRTALHYAALCPDPQLAWSTLIRAGVHPAVKDKLGRTAKFYMDHPDKLAKSTSDKYAGHAVNQEFIMKPSSIRIWIHDQDLNRLLRVVWEGHGSKLLTETSRQPTVKRFLESVPFIMGKVRDIHQSTIQNDLPKLMKVSAEPVPVEALSSKDCNGLTPLHKAAGLGFKDIVEYLLSKDANVNQADSFGRTPLHYAAMKFGNSAVYKLLLSNGAVDNTPDSKGKLPRHYLSKPNDRLEACLTFVPSAPRTADLFPMAWDWDLFNTKPRVILKSRSSLQAEREGEDFVSTRKTKSEGNLNKLPVKRKVKKMFEEDEVGKNKTNTLILDPYNKERAGRKQQKRAEEDTTADNDFENVKIRSRSRTIGGPLQSIAGKSKNNISSYEENIDLSELENTNEILKSREKKSNLNSKVSKSDPENTHDILRENQDYLEGKVPYQTSGLRNEKSTLDNEEDDLHPESDYRTSYQKNSEYRQPFSRNYEIYKNHLSENFEQNLNKSIKKTQRVPSNDGNNQGTVRRGGTATLERDTSTKKEHQDLTNSVGRSTDKNHTQEAPESEIIRKHKRRKKHFQTDDSRIIVNTFNSIQDMQKRLEDEINDEENEKKMENPEKNLRGENVASRTVKNRDERERTSKNENTESNVGVDTFDAINNVKDDSIEDVMKNNSIKDVKDNSIEDMKNNSIGHMKNYSIGHMKNNSIEDMKDNSINMKNNSKEDVKKATDEQEEEQRSVAQNDVAVISKFPDDFTQINSRKSLEDAGDAILRNNYNLALMDYRDGDLGEPKHLSEEIMKHSSEDEIGQDTVIKTYSMFNKANQLSHLKSETQNIYNSTHGESQTGNQMESPRVPNRQDFNENDSGAEMSNNDNSSEQECVENEEPHQTNEEPHRTSYSRKQDETLMDNDEAFDINSAERFIDDRDKQADYDKEQRIEELIEEGDLEKLADLILEGDGKLLRGKQSQHSEVQRFLTNVPSYMAKIEQIHRACRRGDLRALLHSLDRRKFAVGREHWSGLRMTPLHVAVLYRNSALVRYLAGRFPESLHARDHHGRTPLHYAGALPERSFYNLLLTLGAYPTLLDDKGLQPSDYIENKQTCYTSLIALYENNPDLYEMEKHRSELVSSGDLVAAGHTSALFIPEEGRYLAAAIGDPLLKGLQKIIKERPDSPLTYLANFLFKYDQETRDMEPPMTKRGISSNGPSQEYMVENQNEIPQRVNNRDYINGEMSGQHSTGKFPQEVTDVQQKMNTQTDEDDYNGKSSTNNDIRAQMNGQRATGKIPQDVTKIQQEINAQRDGHDSAGKIPQHVTKIQDQMSAPMNGLRSTGKILEEVSNQDHINAQMNGHRSSGKIPQQINTQLDEHHSSGKIPQQINTQLDEHHSSGKIPQQINTQLYEHHSSGKIPQQINTQLYGHRSSGKIPQQINTQLYEHHSSGKIPQQINTQQDGHRSSGKIPQEVTNQDQRNAGMGDLVGGTPQGTPDAKAVGNHKPGDAQSVKSSEQAESDDGVGKTSFEPVYRDEHGQSAVHFAASRSQGRHALAQLLEELDANVAHRDELYRTARDVAEEGGLRANVAALDTHVFHMGARGDTEKLLDLLLEGYDHILDLEIEDDIVQEAIKRGHAMTLSLLQSIPTFEERREKLHRAIRLGSESTVREMLNREAKDAKLLAVGKNNRGRCCLHIAILSAQENIVKIISSQFPLTLNIGDNMERTSLHYAMGVAQVETLSAILIQGGAQRTIKDLKGRTASYYFMNKSAIRALQEEENMLRI